MLGSAPIGELPIAGGRDGIIRGVGELTASVEGEPPFLTMLMDETGILVWAVELYPGIVSTPPSAAEVGA